MIRRWALVQQDPLAVLGGPFPDWGWVIRVLRPFRAKGSWTRPGTCFGLGMSGGMKPVNGMKTIQDSIGAVVRSFWIFALAPRSIVDGADLIPFIDPSQGAWAELCRVTLT